MAEQSRSIDALNLSGHLRERILCRVPPPTSGTGGNVVDTTPEIKGDNKHDKTNDSSSPALSSFVLYLPTVVLRAKHNPAFALACYLANRHGVPLLVLATVLDDTHLEQQQQQQQQRPEHNKNGNANAPVVATARRLAFTLEALQECCKAWESHGAGVAIRVHGPGCRTPHHLSLAHSGAALAVVSDEPFVEPYRTYVRRIARACRSVAGSVPFYTVDGSTSVPPKSRLVRIPNTRSSDCCNGAAAASPEGDDVWFSGAPSKAWRWEKQTESVRKQHVYGACREKELDAPDLLRRLPPDWFVEGSSGSGTIDADDARLRQLRQRMPSRWTDKGASSPGQRPWTVSEFCAIENCKSWASAWHGADNSVPPCKQTHGSRTSAKRRWRAFVGSGGLRDYARKRNGVTNPHAVSRISCYLNLGILSIFEVIRDVWEARSIRGNATGCAKFLEEVVKWREGSYVHAFANPNYHSVDVLPAWAIRCLESKCESESRSNHGNGNGNGNGSYTYQQLESASTNDETWNAMQDYLIDTGELHNNARMTWGKTVVHWQAGSLPPDEILKQLCRLNDRFALDGLSPPSYGGILWCFGWQDKPAAKGKGGGVSEKWARRYRTGPDGFLRAKDLLLVSSSSSSSSSPSPSPATERTDVRTGGAAKRSAVAFASSASASASDRNRATGSPDRSSKRARVGPAKRGTSKTTILSYFGPTATRAKARRSSG